MITVGGIKTTLKEILEKWTKDGTCGSITGDKNHIVIKTPAVFISNFTPDDKANGGAPKNTSIPQ